MLRAFWCNDDDVLAEIAFAQEQRIAGNAATTSFVVIPPPFGFDRAALLFFEGCVDAAVRLRRRRYRRNAEQRY